MLDVWDFGRQDGDEDWVGEPPGGLYDEDSDYEDDEDEQVEGEPMDQDVEIVPSDTDEAQLDDSEQKQTELLESIQVCTDIFDSGIYLIVF